MISTANSRLNLSFAIILTETESYSDGAVGGSKSDRESERRKKLNHGNESAIEMKLEEIGNESANGDRIRITKSSVSLIRVDYICHSLSMNLFNTFIIHD